MREVLLRDLNSLRAEEFLDRHLFDRVPHVFNGDRSSFVSWKALLAKAIEVDPACIAFVGSSAVGISLNPNKGFKDFNTDSDIDVGIISSYHFSVSWRYLRSNSHRRLSVDTKTRVAWDEHANRFVYWGTIATDRLLGILPFGTQWLSAVTKMTSVTPTTGRDIKLRIYNDYESLRAYQITSVKRARDEGLTTRN